MNKGIVRLTIKFNRNLNEYSVNPYINGKRNEDQTYYTDDKQDAQDTKLAMEKEYLAKGFIIAQ